MDLQPSPTPRRPQPQAAHRSPRRAEQPAWELHLAVGARRLLLAGDLLVGRHPDVALGRRRLGLALDRVFGDRGRHLGTTGALAALGGDVLLGAAVLAAARRRVVLLLAPFGHERSFRSPPAYPPRRPLSSACDAALPSSRRTSVSGPLMPADDALPVGRC